MKILILKTAPGEIDISKITYNHQEVGLAKAFLRAGHQCDIMCCAEDEPSEQNIDVAGIGKITLYCMRANIILKNGILYDAEPILKNYDIIQASEYNQIYTWFLSRRFHERLVVYHGPYYCEFNKRYNLMASLFDLFFVKRYQKLNTTFVTKSKLAEQYLKNKKLKNVTSIGVGVDVEALSSHVNDELLWMNEINQNSDKKILYIGRLEPRRNVFFLLDVLEELNKSMSVSLVVVGRGEETYVDEFFTKISEKKLEDKILYKESVEQRYMEQLYGCADIFVLPTIYDIYGMVLLEAMLFGKCVITTPNGGSNMMIRDGVNGYVKNHFDEADWCTTIRSLLLDDNLRIEISQNATQTIRQEYTWDVLVDKFLKVYDEKRKNNG